MRPDISELKQCLQKLRPPARDAKRTRVSSGCEPLDRLLPQRGFVRGSLVEWLSGAPGSGASVLAMAAAREAGRKGGALVVVDRSRTFYPPAATAWSIDLKSTIVVRPRSEKDEHWALDQALRCPHVAAVLAWPQRLDHRTFRRLQLAAEGSGCLGLFIRPAQAQTEPTWADVRLLVSPVGRNAIPSIAPDGLATRRTAWRLRVDILRSPGCLKKSEVTLEIDHQTGEIHESHSRHLAAKLARAKTAPRKARA